MNQKEYSATFTNKPAIIMANIYLPHLGLGEYTGSTKPLANIPHCLTGRARPDVSLAQQFTYIT